MPECSASLERTPAASGGTPYPKVPQAGGSIIRLVGAVLSEQVDEGAK